MKIPKETLEQWYDDYEANHIRINHHEYIAQRATDYALEEAAAVVRDDCGDAGEYLAQAILALKEKQE